MSLFSSSRLSLIIVAVSASAAGLTTATATAGDPPFRGLRPDRAAAIDATRVRLKNRYSGGTLIAVDHFTAAELAAGKSPHPKFGLNLIPYSEIDRKYAPEMLDRLRSVRVNPNASKVGVPIPGEGMPAYSFRMGPQSFIRPIAEPELQLRSGDILVYFSVDPADSSEGLLSLLMGGMTHAGLVFRKSHSQAIEVLQSPRDFVNSLRGRPYHVIRLREDVPPAFENFPAYQALRKVRPDWERLTREVRWGMMRNRILTQLNHRAIRLAQKSFAFDHRLNTEVAVVPEKIDVALTSPGESFQFSLYCAELPFSLYRLSGARLPSLTAKLELIHELERKVYPELVRQMPNLSREARWSRALQYILVEGGLGINDFTSDALRKTLLTVLMAPPETREALIRNHPETAHFLSFISPSDLFGMSMDENSAFAYFGSYVGEYGVPIDDL